MVLQGVLVGGRMLCKSMLWCCLFFVLGTKRVCTFSWYKGYDKEETATGIFKGYCIPMSYNYEIGLCQGYSGTAKVCAATSKADNQFSAEYYKANEVMSSTSAIMDKTLVKGGTFFKQLALYMITKACSQIGPNVQVNGNLNDDQIQKGACNFVWRRDQVKKRFKLLELISCCRKFRTHPLVTHQRRISHGERSCIKGHVT